jgi:hypothetical protein
MGALSDLIQDPAKRKAVVDDSVRAIDAEVAGKRGLSGAVVKAGFKMVKGVSPGFIPKALDHLLDDFARQVDPFYTDWQSGENGSLDSYFQRRAPEIADALLAITDDRARNAKNRGVKKAYGKLRGKAAEHTIAAMPRVSRILSQHVGS